MTGQGFGVCPRCRRVRALRASGHMASHALLSLQGYVVKRPCPGTDELPEALADRRTPDYRDVVPAMPPLDDLPGWCDWSCDSTEPVAWRWHDGAWLPVCAEHASPLADETGAAP